jgi:NitT/TauT family transport system substrate-binding protein
MKNHFAAFAGTASLVVLSVAGCSKTTTTPETATKTAAAPKELAKVKVGTIGLTCEAPIYTAYENGYFKDEGIEVEFVRCEWKAYKDTLALGGFDITHHLIMMLLKPIEQGLDAKIMAGVHTGCLRVQAATDGPIKKVEDLKGKRIGVPGMGTPPFIFANRALHDHGIDPSKDIEWKTFPAGELGLALKKGEVDAVADSEPIGTMLLADGTVKNVADQAVDAPYKDEFCCAVMANGKWASANPKLAAAATRAILKGAKFVQTNPRAAARMAVEKKYIASTPELNTTAIGNLVYRPSIDDALKSVRLAAVGMKQVGMLNASTDVDELAKKAWMPLEGVTDQWIESIKVEKVADGQIPADQKDRLLAELQSLRTPLKIATCCTGATTVPLAQRP